MIKIGQKVKFDPFKGIRIGGMTTGTNKVSGTVVYINTEHRYFTVEYKLGDETFKNSFNFNDLTGPHRNVYIVKE